jgi:hypothetical protein
MEENKIKNPEVIDLRVVFRKIWDNRRLFYKVLPIVFVLSCIYIFSLPRYYTSDIKLAPEMENSGAGGTLGSIAASFGFDLSEMQTTDAITPLLYPELMEDNGFVYSLWNIPVADKADTLHTTYYDYLAKYQKYAWWEPTTEAIKQFFSKEETGVPELANRVRLALILTNLPRNRTTSPTPSKARLKSASTRRPMSSPSA